jgi:hypothetical protein
MYDKGFIDCTYFAVRFDRMCRKAAGASKCGSRFPELLLRTAGVCSTSRRQHRTFTKNTNALPFVDGIT